jgi:riboflavin synthase
MFTGIITDIGEIVSRDGDAYRIRSRYPADGIGIGASIACSGCCLTVTDRVSHGEGSIFTVDVSNETRSKTNLDTWQPGVKINLERALQAGAELGGHIVTGHVDGVAKINHIEDDGECRRFLFEVPEHLAPYIAPKGSVAIDGTSLTVNEVAGSTFGVNLIPHTLTVTTWGDRTTGDTVNLEVDLFARYIARLMEFRT